MLLRMPLISDFQQMHQQLPQPAAQAMAPIVSQVLDLLRDVFGVNLSQFALAD